MALPLEPETAPMFDLGDLPAFTDALDVERLAEQVMPKYRELRDLHEAVYPDPERELGAEIRIAYLFDNAKFDMAKDEVTHSSLGKAMKAPPVWRHLAGTEAVITFRSYFWERFDERQRSAVLMHQLLHLEVAGPGKLALREHGVEEFGDVLRRFGAYLPHIAAAVNSWAKWESDQGGAPANIAAHRAEYATRVARPEPDQLGRAARDARRGKPPAKSEPDPDRLTCDGDNHVPGCEHLEPRS